MQGRTSNFDLYHQEVGIAVLRFLNGGDPIGLPEDRSISMHFEIGGAYEDWGYRVTVNEKHFEHKSLLEALKMAKESK